MNEIYEILLKEGCIKAGHFLLKSGKHSGFYCDMKYLSLKPRAMTEVCRLLANKIADAIPLSNIDVVVGPAVGAIIPAYQIASILNKRNNFTEKKDGQMYFRNNDNIFGKNVFVIEDVATTGGTIYQTIDAVKAFGGKVVGVGVIVDRSEGRAAFNVPFVSGCEAKFTVYEPNDCKICKEAQIPLYKLGSKN